MLYRLLADGVVVLHLGFILYVVLGGLLVIRRPKTAFLHLPIVVWGALIELVGWTCPLTPLENILRARAGQEGYATGFIEHYLLPLIYPARYTKGLQIELGLVVILLNLVLYALAARRWKDRARATRE